jgi:hypothetical protein
MKKLLLSAAALACFASAQAQWATNGFNIYNTNAGSVGIGTGTAAPSGRLDVAGSFYTGNGTLLMRPGDAANEGGEVILLGASTHPNFHMDNFSGRLRFFNGSVGEIINMFSNGHVGIANRLSIGTYTTGNYKLVVEGKVGAREVVVTTAPWADYVFASNYKLRPLSEVARFIEENKHLPEVPTAAEVAKNGNSLAETDALLLRKIEELTLYAIEQHKQLQELKAQNQALQNEVNNLKK